LEPDRDQDIISRLITEAMERQPDIWIQITVPNEFQPIGKYNIGITAGAETTRPPGQFVEGINRMDLTIVPSEFVKDAFKDNIYELYDKRINKKVKTVALEKAIEVIFEGVNTDIFKPIIVDHENDFIKGLDNIEEDFCFLFVGH
jgi:hypothetical protein